MKYTQEIKTEVERCFQDSWTISSISSKYAIPYSTVYRWKQDYLSNYKSEEKSNLYKILYRKRQMAKYLKIELSQKMETLLLK